MLLVLLLEILRVICWLHIDRERERALSIDHLQLFVVLKELILAKSMGWMQTVIETDSKKVASWITGEISLDFKITYPVLQDMFDLIP